MSKLVKEVKRGIKSVGSRVEGAFKGDPKSLLSIGTLGMSDLATRPIEYTAGKVSDALLPDLPSAADIASQIPSQGATPGQVQTQQANVDLGFTEGQRRRSGAARGASSLRLPIGGIRR